MPLPEAARLILEGAARYAELRDQPSRTSVRAEVLHLLEQLQLQRERPLAIRRLQSAEFGATASLRGGVSLQLDLVFRSSVSPEEIHFTVERGLVLIAEHPDLPLVPVGVILVMPANRLIKRRWELFADPPSIESAPVVMPFAITANPRRLGAGGKLVAAAQATSAGLPNAPRVATFSPMTGMRARLVRIADDPHEWRAAVDRYRSGSASVGSTASPDVLRAQVLDLLRAERMPDPLPEPARSLLRGEAGVFGASSSYAVGEFHRSNGASLVGIVDCADPADDDALWFRAWFDYGRVTP